MNKDVGMVSPVVFHTPRYLNFGGFDHDVQKARHWYHGRVLRKESFDYGSKDRGATRQTFKSPVSDPVLDRLVYLFADRDLTTGATRLHVCATVHIDASGGLAFFSKSGGIEPDAEVAAAITLPQVIDGHKIRYFAIAAKVQLSPDDLDTWIQAFDGSGSGGSQVDYQIGFVDFDYTHTFLGVDEFEIPRGTDENGDVITDTGHALRFPVLDPLHMALAHASKLSGFLRAYEREFGFHKSLINYSSAKVDDEVAKFSKYRLAVALATAQNAKLRAKIDDIGDAGLNQYLRTRAIVQGSYQEAVDLAAGNLASWLRREVVLAWINLCHSGGLGVISEDAVGQGTDDGAKACVLEDFGRAIHDLHQTRPGNVLAEILHQRRAELGFIDAYLYDGKAMAKAFKSVRSGVGQVMSIKKLVLGRLIARGKKTFVDTLTEQGGYLTAADLLDDVDDIYERESRFLTLLVTGNRSTLSDENLALEAVDLRIGKLKKTLGSAEAASGLVSMLGWFVVMDQIHTYAELRRNGNATVTDDITVASAITAQALSTAELILGDRLKDASKIGLKISLSAIGVVVNVVDAGLKMDQAEKLFAKGDTDAGLLTGASAILIITAIPFGVMGMWLGPAIAIVAGILGLIATFVTDEVWDRFLNNTAFGTGDSGGTYAPDWAGVTLDALRGNPALQLRALGNLLHNFTVRRLGGGTGKRFGTHTLFIEMATPDPMAVFVITWHFHVGGETGVVVRTTVASVFSDGTTPADGKTLRIPGTIRGPDGDASIESLERAAVKVVSPTSLHVGDPRDMRAPEGHAWHRRSINAVRVEVQRLNLQSFGRPRASSAEWHPTVVLDMTDLAKMTALYKDT